MRKLSTVSNADRAASSEQVHDQLDASCEPVKLSRQKMAALSAGGLGVGVVIGDFALSYDTEQGWSTENNQPTGVYFWND